MGKLLTTIFDEFSLASVYMLAIESFSFALRPAVEDPPFRLLSAAMELLLALEP